jgi:hypothetical protein
VPLSSWSSEDAELVAFRVGQDDPGDDALTDVDASSAEVHEPLNLCPLVIRSEVKMKPVLGRRLGGIDWLEDDPRELIGFLANLELTRVIVDHGPFERHGPPSTERDWVNRVDDQLVPSKAHIQMLRRR